MKKLYILKSFYNLHKRLIINILNFGLLILLMNANCNKNDVLSPEDTDITNEAAFMKNTVEIQKICSNANSYLILVANNITTISGSCPAVTVSTPFNTITVDYGATPCTNSLDQVKRSGSYTISYFINSGKDSMSAVISLNNYRVYKGDTSYIAITGNDEISSKKILGSQYQSTFNSSNTFTINTGKVKTANVNMTVNSNIGDPYNYSDDVYNIKGSGTVANQTLGLSYGYSIDPNFAITYQTNCKYPTYGKVYLGFGGYIFTVDFSPNNSSCDAIISITKYGVTKTIDLSEADF
jgi:hypothetical protein